MTCRQSAPLKSLRGKMIQPDGSGVTRRAVTPAIALRARAARDRGMRRLSGQRVMLQNTILVASDRRP